LTQTQERQTASVLTAKQAKDAKGYKEEKGPLIKLLSNSEPASSCDTVPRSAFRGTDSPVVELRGVSKSFARGNSTTCVVDHVDLRVQRGECVFLLGPSGSGKSTLLSIIGCVLTADEGEVRLLGEEVSRLNPDEAARLRLQRIGFVFQRFHLIRGLSAAENVAVPLTLAGWTAPRARLRAGELLEQVGMSGLSDAQPNRLSVGQCQRVAFARALAADPELILADEPTASLDAKTGHQALDLLRHLTVASGKTVIVVTHDPRILPFADRILQMENGRVEERGHDRNADRGLSPFQFGEFVGGVSNADEALPECCSANCQ
jgi:putative ABC transport system ATP-binding protein